LHLLVLRVNILTVPSDMSLAPTDPALVVASTKSNDDEQLRSSLCSGAEEKVWFTIPAVFFAAECAALRDRLDAIFDEHCTEPGQNGRTARDHVDSELTKLLWERLAAHVPTSFGGQSRVGPHPMMRIMRYEAQGSLSAHLDGTLEHCGQISFLTAFLYLNDNFSGGDTRFFQSSDFCDETFRYDGKGIIDITPREGTLNVFQHNLWHMGLPVMGAQKYGIRIMIMYELGKDSIEDAQLTHIWVPDT